MPFSRPTLSQLKTQIAQDINSNLPGADALLRFSNLGILGKALAYLINLCFGYLDWIALQAVPFTATDEAMYGWGALKGVFRLPAVQAGSLPSQPGVISFPCTGAPTVPAGTLISRGDGVQYISLSNAIGAAGAVLVPAEAVADPTGLTGAFGNCPIGTTMTLGTAILNVQSTGAVVTAFTGGADIETPDAYHTRMIQAYQVIPGAGGPSQYIEWARQVNGVTRAWCKANGMGTGTVVVYTMWDVVEAAHGGFPQGTNGVATAEPRDTVATGDQLAVANYIFPLQPATPLVYSVAPNPDAINFTITNLTGASPALQASIAAALGDVFVRNASATGGTMYVQDFEDAIASVSGTTGFVMTVPAANHISTTGNLPIRGTVTYP